MKPEFCVYSYDLGKSWVYRFTADNFEAAEEFARGVLMNSRADRMKVMLSRGAGVIELVRWRLDEVQYRPEGAVDVW